MAKKKSHKKHSFKYAEPTVAHSEVMPKRTEDVRTSAPFEVAANAEYPYLKGDLIRLGFIAASLIAAEVGLWLLFGHTSIGQAVYNLYHVAG